MECQDATEIEVNCVSDSRHSPTVSHGVHIARAWFGVAWPTRGQSELQMSGILRTLRK